MATTNKAKAAAAAKDGPGTGNERMPGPNAATGASGSSLDAPKTGAAAGANKAGPATSTGNTNVLTRRDPRPRHTGPPERPLQGRVQTPPQTEAQLAAGPLRPEPAKPVIVGDGGGSPAADPDVQKVLAAPIKWVKVRATKTGFAGVGMAGVRRRAGDVFLVDDRFFSASWMELVPASTPEGRKTGQDIINEEHDAVLGGKTSRPTGDVDALGAE
jgi:hypothetical protein